MKNSPHGVNGDCFDPVRMGSKGAVVANHPITAGVGIGVLKKGGNAVDAAVAMGFAVGVAEPNAGGIGGDAMLMKYDQSTGKVKVVDGSGPAPKSLDILENPLDRHGIRSVVVPGAPKALIEAQRKWGQLTLAECMDPSLSLCETGVAVSHYQANMTRKYPRLHEGEEEAKIFAPDARPLEAGELRRNADLAKTYRGLVREGAEYFYEGPVAKSLVEMSDREGGYVQLGDFAQFDASIEEAVSTTYHGFRVFGAGPNSAGCTLLQMLNIVENFDLGEFSRFSHEAIHIGVEAKRLAFLDREQYIGDPRFVDIPLKGLLSKGYARERASLISLDKRREALLPGNPWSFEGREGVPGEYVRGVRQSPGDTTHLCVVDKDGNAVSLMMTINNMFGAQLVAPGTGVLLNNRMIYWHQELGHPNTIRPGGRVRHNLCPVMVFNGEKQKDQNLRWILGTPGGDTIAQTIYQAISALIDHNCTEAEAIQSARWAYSQNGTSSNHPHQEEDLLKIEDRNHEQLLQGLEGLGHTLKTLSPWGGTGSAGVIGIHPSSGARLAAADLRREGQALIEI